MKLINELPLIAVHLDLKTYQNLRFSIQCSLPKIQKTTAYQYKQTTVQYPKIHDISEYISTGNDMFEYFCMNNHLCIIKNVIQQIPKQTINDILVELVFSELEFDVELGYLLYKHCDFTDLVDLLFRVIETNDLNFVKELIGCVDITVESNYAIRQACLFGYYDMVKLLLENGADPSDYNNDALFSATQTGSLEIVELLLRDPRVDPSDMDSIAFRNACSNGHYEIVKSFIRDNRTDFQADNNFGLGVACDNGYTNIVRLLSDICDPTDNDYYAFKAAIENGNLETLKLILKQQEYDFDLVGFATTHNQIQIVEYLLACGIDPTKNDCYSLRHAVKHQQIEIFKLLLKDNRVDPRIRNNYPIGKASELGNMEMVQILLKYDIDPYDEDYYALKASYLNKHFHIVNLLLQDPRLKNPNILKTIFE
ncbi:hypothetical protein HDV04_006260 [Boothiomyces sp. JEL0838]|nr:hypothetical protein HDV04_006260 [Boothiomyces sp. JEL0838]